MVKSIRHIGARVALVAIAASTLLAQGPAPAKADEWSIVLTASETIAESGSSVTLTATASRDVSYTGYSIIIYSGQTWIRGCGRGTTCTTSVSRSVGTDNFTAYIESGDASPPRVASSREVTVVWLPPSECSSSATRVCATRGREVTRARLVDASVAEGNDVAVRGWLDEYQFTFPTGTIASFPCLVLLTDRAGVNPCAAAGGVFVRRYLALIEREATLLQPVLPVSTMSVGVCEAVLSATVEGFGVDSTPGYTIC